MSTVKLFLSSFVLVLASCSITIPNTRVGATSGMMTAGADCAWTLSDETSELNLDEWIAFLEPQEGSGAVPARGAAICQSAEDWNRQKTALEQACRKLGRWCTMEVKAKVEEVTTRVDTLQAKVVGKARRRWQKTKTQAAPVSNPLHR